MTPIGINDLVRNVINTKKSLVHDRMRSVFGSSFPEVRRGDADGIADFALLELKRSYLFCFSTHSEYSPLSNAAQPKTADGSRTLAIALSSRAVGIEEAERDRSTAT